MSLILEALKKSEEKRRLGAAPDLATPFSAPRRRSWVLPIAVLLVVAGVVAWALRPAAPSKAPTETAAAPKQTAPITNAAPTPGQKTGAPLHSVTGNNNLVETAPPPVIAKPPVRPAGGKFVPGQPDTDANVAPTPETRSGREIFEAMRAKGAEQALANQQAAASVAKPSAPPAKPNPKVGVARTARAPAPTAAPPRAAASTQPVTPPPVAAPAPAPPSTAAAAPPEKSDTAAAASARAPKSSSTIGLTPPPAAPAATSAKPVATSNAQPYAELPFSVRKSLPELKLSMHVYAADPSHRFVVLNDARLTEGEKTSDEIFVREIRPDGVVLEFQNQRFFYPRDGL
jgi:general secretion pathway protein B